MHGLGGGSRREREPKQGIHFRDDLSEYSCPSTWGDWEGPRFLGDCRLSPDGLQARRTVGEAILRAQWDKQRDATAEACAEKCRCLGPRAARLSLGAMRRAPPQSSFLFQWSEVQSVILVPYEERGPYLICVTTFRPREDGSREWMLISQDLRARARWGIEMMAAILRDRCTLAPQPPQQSCCSGGVRRECGGLSLSLFMEMARIACEVAKHQPSNDSMDRLVETLDLLAAVDSSASIAEEAALLPAPYFPRASLLRFSDCVKRASAELEEWLRWWELSLLVKAPVGWDIQLWRGRVLPFLCPAEVSATDSKAQTYPASVDHQLSIAAERWRRTFA